MAKQIRKVGVLGAGVMGSGIAAHVAGAGYPVLLLDIVPPFPAPEGVDATSKAWRNKFAEDAKAKLLKAKPNAYHDKQRDPDLVEVGNLDDDLERLNECDWVIEAVKEDLDVKRTLFARIDAIRHADLVLTSNTSGLPIAKLTEGRSEGFTKHFFVTHFFNPPRYMRLLEIVLGPQSDADAVARTVKFGEEVLGKGIVYGKDTPNFVANRIGTFGMLDAMHEMLKTGLTPEEADALLGKPVGHPKSALFRTGDIVGLDTLVHVADNCYDLLETDPSRDTFKVPAYVRKMVEAKQLGDKTKGGFYKKTKEGLFTLDPTTGEYRPQVKPRLDIIGELRDYDDVRDRIRVLAKADDKYGQFAWNVTARSLAYAARLLGEIADDVVQVDRAMRWGFNWELGPFQTWDALGFKAGAERMKKDGVELPKWADEMLTAGVEGFYRNDESEFYDPFAKAWKPVPFSKRVLRLPKRNDKRAVASNDSATLFDIGDGVFCVEFHSKMNSVDADNIQMIVDGLARAEAEGQGLVIGNEATDAFSAGANIGLMLGAARSGEFGEIEAMSKGMQDALMLVKHANVPVVAAPFGLTLGGGAEVAFGAQAIRAHCELYMGLVEVGVGLIPGGGGTKEVLWRVTSGARPEEDLFPYIQRAFELVGMAKVSFSAAEARAMGFLTATDGITFNREQLIHDAKATVIAMNIAGFKPTRPRLIRVGGRPAFANLQAALWSMEQAHQVSAHDRKIATKLAYVLTGGDVPANAKVTEQYLLDLEREAFISLIGEPMSQDRMEHMLLKGKPLRN